MPGDAAGGLRYSPQPCRAGGAGALRALSRARRGRERQQAGRPSAPLADLASVVLYGRPPWHWARQAPCGVAAQARC